jgi:phthalate 4,5-dioxygenase oxygenase subunit
MLTQHENDRLTRIEGDAPMGRLLRRYWFPALPAEDVAEPDGDPVPVRLLGEDLIAFRDSRGRVGLVDEFCPHRMASFLIGRNENCGITCIYHGWKFDVNGACVDMPTEPVDKGFQNRVSIRAYPTHETAGMIWTYMGPPEHQPPFPAFAFTTMPAEQVGLVKVSSRMNFMQSVEGAIDSAHSWFLHRGSSRDWAIRIALSSDTSPRLETEDTPYGFRYAAIRTPTLDPETTKYVRVTQFVAPFFCIIPPPLDRSQPVHCQIFVPIDDGNTMLFDVYFSQDGSPVSSDALRAKLGAVRGVDLDERDFRFARRENRWLQDRAAMKAGDWTGIAGFQNQDIAAQESMGGRGGVVDRTREHLGMSDIAVIRMRRRMLENVARLERGETPIGLEPGIPYERIASEQRVIPIETPWQTVGGHALEAHAPPAPISA